MDIIRKLASIRKVSEVSPIENSDFLEVVKIDGWQVVTKKGEYSQGDLCVYFEIDSYLPIIPEFEFLRKSCYRNSSNLGEGYRIKTIKLRGELSQGLVVTMNTFFRRYGDCNYYYKDNVDYFVEGDDVTSLLNVKKWETPINPSLSGIAKGNFPSFIPKTDQERIQNIYNKLYESNYNDIFNVTLKLDGSSMTVYYNNGEFGVCSRNLDLKESDGNLFWQVANQYNLREILSSYGKNLALQGELMGPGVQGNREKLEKHKFYVYNVWDIDNQKNLSSSEEEFLFLKEKTFISIDRVPFLMAVRPFANNYTVQKLLETTESIPSINNPISEGVVFKSIDGKTSFKVINNKFLLDEK